MTARERAKEATWEVGCPDWGTKDQEQLEMAVEQAINAAVEEEREACAKIAEDAGADSEWYMVRLADGIAEEIRERGSKPDGGTK